MKSKSLRLFSELIKGNWTKLLLSVGAVFVTAALGFLTPLVLGGTIDALIAVSSGATATRVNLPGFMANYFETRGGVSYLVSHLWILVAFLLFLYLLNGAFQYLRGRLTAEACESFAENARNRLYAHLQSLPYDYHVKAQTGDLVQRCISDVETVRKFLSNQAVEGFRTIAMLCIGVPILLSIDAPLTFYSTMLFLPIFVFALWFFHWVMRYFAVSDAAEGRMSAVLQENLNAVRVVRAFGRQRFEEEKFDVANGDLHDKSKKLYDIMSTFWAGTDMLGTAQIGISLIAGVMLAAKGKLTAGEITVFASYVSLMIWPMRQLGRVLSEFGKSLVSLGRLNDILEVPPEKDDPGALTPPLNGNIEFDHVSLSYTGGTSILKDVSFTAAPGEVIALLGPTGSGKSTLIHLLQRLYEPTAGEIRIGGININRISKAHLRRRVGLVLQEPFLYSRTLRDNIAITDPLARDDEVLRVSRLCAANTFIESFQRGYETLVGENGVTLSGGQKQRVSIARTLLREKDILIFDDSLSALDTQTERGILDALKKQRQEGALTATVFLISHRLNTLAAADRILVLEDGQITQDGTHETLAGQEGLYRRVLNIQSTLVEEIA